MATGALLTSRAGGFGFCAGMRQLALWMAFSITAMDFDLDGCQLMRHSKSMFGSSDEYIDVYPGHMTRGEYSGFAGLAVNNLFMMPWSGRCEVMTRSAANFLCGFEKPNHVQTPEQHVNCLAFENIDGACYSPWMDQIGQR